MFIHVFPPQTRYIFLLKATTMILILLECVFVDATAAGAGAVVVVFRLTSHAHK